MPSTLKTNTESASIPEDDSWRDESFRDSIGTLDNQGKRKWIYALQPHGRFYNARTWVTVIYLLLFFGIPYLSLNGHPFLLFNILERKFVIFGQPFWPQDFHLVVIAFLMFVVGIALFTMAFGRLFCGWICPQTIFMEMLFRRLEYLIEGDAAAQRRLHSRPWDGDKVARKIAVNAGFVVLTLVITTTFLMYFVGYQRVFQIIAEGPGEHLAAFIGYGAFAFLFFIVYVRVREQVCIIACPYGRLQGVLLDTNTVVVAYDYVRGEPRKSKEHPKDHGSCVSCNACVRVCPTGIDIRNGTQLECVNCTACIDACDDIMDKVGQPRGLVRYASQNEIAEGRKFKWTPRMKFYSGLLAALFLGFMLMLFNRSDVETTLLRQAGSLYQTLPNGNLTNVYTLQLVNKTLSPVQVEFRLESPAGGSLRFQNNTSHIQSDAEEVTNGLCIIELPRTAINGMRTNIEIGVYLNGEREEVIETAFMGPGGL